MAPEDASDPADGSWLPAGCTLPTVEQPARRREFDHLFADVASVLRESPTRTRFGLRPEEGVAARAATLAVKETGCCSFFTFDLALAPGEVYLGVRTDAGHEDVLAALTTRVEQRLAG